MNKEKLNERLFFLEQQIQQLNNAINQMNANLNMLMGGREEILYWLQELSDKGDSNE